MIKLKNKKSINGYKVYHFDFYRASETTGSNYTEITVTHNLKGYPIALLGSTNNNDLYLKPDYNLPPSTTHERNWYIPYFSEDQVWIRFFRNFSGSFKMTLILLDSVLIDDYLHNRFIGV